MEASTKNVEKTAKELLERALKINPWEKKKSRKFAKNAAFISDSFLELYRKEHTAEYKNFLEKNDLPEVIKADMMCLFEAQMILKILHKHLDPIDIDAFDIKEFITHHLKPHVQRIAKSKSLSYSLAAKDAVEALNTFDLNNLDSSTECEEEVLNRFLNAILLNKDGSFNSDYIPDVHSKDTEEQKKDNVSEKKTGETFSPMPMLLFDRAVRSVIETHFKPHFSSKPEWEDLEKALITDYFQDLFRDKYFSTFKIVPENQYNPKFNEDQFLILIETKMIFREKLKHSNDTYHSRIFLKNFVNERLKPSLKKIENIPNSKLSSIVQEALEALTIPDYKKKHEELRESKEKPSPPIWLIVSLIAVVTFFAFVVDDIKLPNKIYFIVFVFLVMLGLVKIADALSEKKMDKLIGESDVLIHKKLASERKFRSTNLIDYCPPPILKKFLVLKPGEVATGKDHAAESEEETSAFKSKQRMEEIAHWAPEIEDRLRHKREKKKMAEHVPEIVKISEIKGVMYDPDLPQSEDARKLVEFYTDQPEKKEYLMYSHDFPQGKEITAREFHQRKDEFDPEDDNHLFFIFNEEGEYFNGEIPIPFPNASKEILIVLLNNSPKYLSTLTLYNILNSSTLTNKDMKKKQRGYIQRAITDLRAATFKKINLYLDFKRKVGYKFTLADDLFFSLIEKIDF